MQVSPRAGQDAAHLLPRGLVLLQQRERVGICVTYSCLRSHRCPTRACFLDCIHMRGRSDTGCLSAAVHVCFIRAIYKTRMCSQRDQRHGIDRQTPFPRPLGGLGAWGRQPRNLPPCIIDSGVAPDPDLWCT